MKALNDYIEHTLLKPTARPEDIVTLCKEAKKYNFHSVCVNSCYVYLAANQLKGSKIKVVTTIGFPLGASSTKAKVSEAKKAIKQGANEIDMVMNIGYFKGQLTKSVREEISAVKKVMGDKVLKVIIETCFLSNSEKELACKIVRKAKADYIKTSTGFGEGGAQLMDIAIMKAIVGDNIQIKASGGIRTRAQAIAFIEAGASRIGTSNGVQLLLPTKEEKS